MDWHEERLLIKIARMYYEENMTQSEIAETLGIYRTTIGRMLKKARKKGIVTIHIKGSDDARIELESQITNAFRLKETVVVPSSRSDTPAMKKRVLGKAGFELLKRIIKDGDVVGFAWGTTLASLAEEVSEHQKTDVRFVPLVGGPGQVDVKHHVNTIVYNVANAFNGKVYFIDAAAIVPTKETRDDIMSSGYMQEIQALWEKLSIAVVGIGAPLSSSNLIWTGFFGEREIEELSTHGAAGDICSRFFDGEGRMVRSEIDQRTIAIELERLKDLRYSVGIAASLEKVSSILAALRGGYLNTLITDEETARALITAI